MSNINYSLFDDIPMSEIRKDILDTQKEIDQYEAEIVTLMKMPVSNRLEIYMREGRIGQRQAFIDKLNNIIEFRNE